VSFHLLIGEGTWEVLCGIITVRRPEKIHHAGNFNGTKAERY